MHFKELIEKIHENCLPLNGSGLIANYIPELAVVDPNKFGVHITTVEQIAYGTGDYSEKFSTQSMVKVLSLAMAMRLVGEGVWRRIGVEPSGTAFNSLVQLEVENGKPRNPFINSGAIVVADVLLSQLPNPKQDFLDFTRSLSGDVTIDYNLNVAESEKQVAYRNLAVCNLMKSFGNIQNPVHEVIDFYCTICSLEMSCEQASTAYLFLANQGQSPFTKQEILTKRQTKRINALMQTCGMYDESGEFAFKVGLPGKSGVGGGIIAIHPNNYAICVWSPELNAKGNSYQGVRFLETFTTESEFSIF